MSHVSRRMGLEPTALGQATRHSLMDISQMGEPFLSQNPINPLKRPPKGHRLRKPPTPKSPALAFFSVTPHSPNLRDRH